MKREILFRGKRKDNGEWVSGCYYKQSEFYGDEVDDHRIITSHEDLSFDQALDYYDVQPETVGQFTGLTDKNGKKIFEGDICTYPDGWTDHAGDGVETFSVGVVTWYNEHPCFYLTNNIGVEWDEIWDSVSEITVIGNIYDNRELLEGGVEECC